MIFQQINATVLSLSLFLSFPLSLLSKHRRIHSYDDSIISVVYSPVFSRCFAGSSPSIKSYINEVASLYFFKSGNMRPDENICVMCFYTMIKIMMEQAFEVYCNLQRFVLQIINVYIYAKSRKKSMA